MLIDALKPLEQLRVGPGEYAGGACVLRKYSDQDLTLTDAVGLHLMKERRIGVCWSTDFHLSLGGAALLTTSSRPGPAQTG